jgi:putative ABC transport system ATP-binding protein
VEPIVVLRDISKTYTNGKEILHALSDVQLTVMQGEFISIMGRSGSGKSTLLNIVGGIDRPDQGEYRFLSENIHAFSPRKLTKFRRQLGFIFQSFHLLRHLTVKQNIELPLGYAGVPVAKRKQTVAILLDKVGLTDKGGSYPHELSGGQMQRVAIARALAPSPKLLLADEPTGNLDSDNGLNIMKLLVEINKEGTAVMLVTHDDNISNFASRKIVMADGIIISQEEVR